MPGPASGRSLAAASLAGLVVGAVACLVLLSVFGTVVLSEYERAKRLHHRRRRGGRRGGASPSSGFLEGGEWALGSQPPLRTGDIVMCAYDFPSNTPRGLWYRVALGFAGTSYTHAGVVFVDEEDWFRGGRGALYLLEFGLRRYTLKPLERRLRRFLPGRAIVRRVRHPADAGGARRFFEEVGLLPSNIRDAKQLGISGPRYLWRTIKRFAGGQHASTRKPENCIDAMVSFLIYAGVWDAGRYTDALPLLDPLRVMYGDIPQIPSLSDAELIVEGP